jgi:hypothetical protein
MGGLLTFRATYLRPHMDSGAFVVDQAYVATFHAWRVAHSVPEVGEMPDPTTGEMLPALGPVENKQFLHVELDRNIANRQRCRVTYRVNPRARKHFFSFVDVEAENPWGGPPAEMDLRFDTACLSGSCRITPFLLHNFLIEPSCELRIPGELSHVDREG